MFLDRDLLRTWSDRVARDTGIDIVVNAWRGLAPQVRAERLAANGDLTRAAAPGGPGWAELARGEVAEALKVARNSEGEQRRPITLLEAEALLAAGAITAGLRCLTALSNAGSVPAAVALARRQHALGDHRGAVQTASALPMHAQATLTAGRALMALHAAPETLRRIEPFLVGGAPIPDTMTGGTFAVLAAAALARSGQGNQLRAFAERLLSAPDTPADTLPSLARVAWTGGLAREAWDAFGDDSDPWMTAGRLELAALAGNAELLRGLVTQAGPLGVQAAPTLALIDGAPVPDGKLEGDKTYHIWRTHPSRWKPWIDAARDAGGQVIVCDLAARTHPDEQAIPALAMDDGALVTMVDPVPVAPRPPSGEGVWIDRNLCAGIGIGHDWTQSEQDALEALVTPAAHDAAAVWVTGADRALAHAAEGRPTVVLAPPGDPFWAGPLPERAWPAFRIVRADPQEGWKGAGQRIAEAAAGLARSE